MCLPHNMPEGLSAQSKGKYPLHEKCKPKHHHHHHHGGSSYVSTAQYQSCVRQCNTTQSTAVYNNNCNQQCKPSDIPCHMNHCAKKYCTTKSNYMGL